ncbi:class I SAM-dependent methyltransferase [Hwangdonia lutea]|uniref:Methyltransferase domain-containing protein n=1 Tax=Hwangdonia lutea TaxID=3075823 RepID=A0AA97HRY6_9FLAO|nr:methyltransferase domain-containing protein [Hwangdonia sp. SCSIO 19198]WOD44520.1 methyltransferase domain-containing protein [Hwangdonia sp. SCSIO 19198]
MKRKIKYLIAQILSYINIGKLLVFLFPKKAEKLSKKGMTLIINNNLSISECLMREAIFKKTKRKSDVETLARLHSNYWVNQGHDFFSATNNRLENVVLPEFTFIFDLLEKELTKTPNQFNTLVEIGTGNGKVLEYLSSKLPQLDRFVGIDLSQVQTDNNKDNYKNNPKLEFVASDALDWVNNHGHSNMIVLTFNGVLEYFTEKHVQQLFNNLNGLGKIIFVAIEPKSIEHDFQAHPNSKIYGFESSFSHNYPKLFENAGFNLWHKSQKDFHSNEYVISFIGAKN